MSARQAVIGETGMRWIREEIDWNTVEPARGTWDWSTPDALYTAAAANGMTVLPLLMLTPGWASTDGSPTQIPSDPSGYAAFVGQVVARYGPHGSFWAAHPALAPTPSTWFELWNEPYYGWFSDNAPDAARYARLVKAAGAAGHAADSGAKMLIESIAQWNDGTKWTSWTGSMYAAVPDLNSYFDGVAVHPYGQSFTDPTATNGFYQDMNNVRADLVSHGAADKPFWLTEIGYATCTGGTSADCYSESAQAQKYTQLADLLRTTYASYVKGVFVYDFQDLAAPAADPTNRESHFGLLRQDGSQKPAYAVVKAAVSAARG